MYRECRLSRYNEAEEQYEYAIHIHHFHHPRSGPDEAGLCGEMVTHQLLGSNLCVHVRYTFYLDERGGKHNSQIVVRHTMLFTINSFYSTLRKECFC